MVGILDILVEGITLRGLVLEAEGTKGAVIDCKADGERENHRSSEGSRLALLTATFVGVSLGTFDDKIDGTNS